MYCDLCLSVSLLPSLPLSVCLYLCLCLSVSICLYLCPCLSVCLSVSLLLSAPLSFFLSHNYLILSDNLLHAPSVQVGGVVASGGAVHGMVEPEVVAILRPHVTEVVLAVQVETKERIEPPFRWGLSPAAETLRQKETFVQFGV